MITCHYCQSFKEIKKSLRRMVGDAPKPKISYRYCRHIHNEVTNTTTACEHFSPAQNLWCRRWDEWIHLIVCIHRHKVRKFGCVRCTQYTNEVSDVARGRDLYDQFGLVRKNHVHLNHNTPAKPILRRRLA